MTTKVIDDFRHPDNEFLGNFSDSYVELEGIMYPTVEHAFQAAKTLNHGERLMVRDANSPRQAKRIGRSVTLRDGWDDMRVGVMRELLNKKFEVVEMRKKLLATNDAKLVSGGDTFWGVVDGQGLNHLGNLLMELRSDIVTEALDDYRRSCRDLLMSCGWTRDMDGDLVMEDECWTPPWDEYCQFDLFSAVQFQQQAAKRMFQPKPPARNLTDVLQDSTNEDGSIKTDALKQVLHTRAPIVVQGDDLDTWDIDDFKRPNVPLKIIQIELFQASQWVGPGLPDEAGKTMAKAYHEQVTSLSEDHEDFILDISVQSLPAGLLVTTFYNSFLEELSKLSDKSFKTAQSCQWKFDWEFQKGIKEIVFANWRTRQATST